jgi:hypothetical protein
VITQIIPFPSIHQTRPRSYHAAAVAVAAAVAAMPDNKHRWVVDEIKREHARIEKEEKERIKRAADLVKEQQAAADAAKKAIRDKVYVKAEIAEARKVKAAAVAALPDEDEGGLFNLFSDEDDVGADAVATPASPAVVVAAAPTVAAAVPTTEKASTGADTVTPKIETPIPVGAASKSTLAAVLVNAADAKDHTVAKAIKEEKKMENKETSPSPSPPPTISSSSSSSSDGIVGEEKKKPSPGQEGWVPSLDGLPIARQRYNKEYSFALLLRILNLYVTLDYALHD